MAETKSGTSSGASRPMIRTRRPRNAQRVVSSAPPSPSSTAMMVTRNEVQALLAIVSAPPPPTAASSAAGPPPSPSPSSRVSGQPTRPTRTPASRTRAARRQPAPASATEDRPILPQQLVLAAEEAFPVGRHLASIDGRAARHVVTHRLPARARDRGLAVARQQEVGERFGGGGIGRVGEDRDRAVDRDRAARRPGDLDRRT